MLVGGLLLTAGAGAQQRPQDLDLQAAIRTETALGDLKKAIAEYQRIVDRYAKTDRAAAANALVRMAECYQKLGDQQATKVFERVVREFGDQKQAAATATARLSSSRPVTTLFRSVWTGSAVAGAGAASADGRYLPFAATDTGDLMVRDLNTGSEVRLTNVGPERKWQDFVSDAAMSRDGTMIAYSWYIDGSQNQLRLTKRVVESRASPRILLDNPEIGYVTPFDWSPRGDWIAVQVKRVDGTAQIGTVDVATGNLYVLRSVDWRGTTRMSVSPDGSWILYDLPSVDGSRDRDLFIISTDGRQQHKVDTRPGYNVAVGWTPDARSVLFAAERSGTVGIWAVAVVSGKPQGAPELLEPDLGAFYASVGMSSSGRLLFLKKVSGINVYSASVDFSAGALLTPPKEMTDSMVQNHAGAMWSPDGRFLAYPSSGRGLNTILIQSVQTGRTRELSPRMSGLQFPRWSTQEYMTFQGVDLKGRQGIYRMDVESGETALMVGGAGSGYLSWAATTPDGKTLVYTRNRSNTLTLMARQVVTGAERELFHGVATATACSPDGKFVAFRTGTQTSSAIMVVPIDGGSPRIALSAEPPVSLAHFVEWLPDGRLLVARWKDKKFDRLLAVSLEGGALQELPPTLNPLGGYFRVHPDGRRVVYSAGDRRFELWALENFLPSRVTTSSRR